MTEQEWEDIDKSFEKLTDALYNLRCDPVYGKKARKAYMNLHGIWCWVKDSRQEWECDNVSP